MLVVPRRVRALPHDNPLPGEALERVHRARGDVDRLVAGLGNGDDAVNGDLHAALSHVHELGVVPVPVRRDLEHVVARAALDGALARPARDGVLGLRGVEEEPQCHTLCGGGQERLMLGVSALLLLVRLTLPMARVFTTLVSLIVADILPAAVYLVRNSRESQSAVLTRTLSGATPL